MIKRLLIFLLTFCTWSELSAQIGLYSTDTIQRIDITFTQSNWDYMLDTAKAGSDGYILAAQCVINGVVYDSVGVKFKGNSSYNSSYEKNPLHIELNYIHGGADYQGYTDIRLSNGYSDPSHIREVLAYEILRNYMDAPLSNFARVTINGAYYGLFSSAESVDSDFNSDHFYSSDNSFFKCNPQNLLSGQLPNLLYLGTDSANYYPRYEIKSTIAWKDLISLCDTLNNSFSEIDTILDVDRALWMLAFNNVAVNLDSYTGAFAQNYYLYRDDNGRFVPVIWDLNMCFGGFTQTGTSNLNVAGMQTMSPVLHNNYGARPLIMKMLNDTTYYRMYMAHMRTITAEFFTSGAYSTRAAQLQTLVDSSVAADSGSFYTYTQFQQSLSTTYGTVPGIQQLMAAREQYLWSTPEFADVPPSITNVTASPAAVAVYDTAWITAAVSGASRVYLGFRDQLWKRFYRVLMFDDGLHQDGAAGDGTYGCMMIASSANLQYYIYAENADAGMFSPQRAEHEFYQYQASISTAGAGEVTVNEILASNVNGMTDNAGQHDDWIELFNTTSSPLGLYGLYLSDDATNHFKFALPDVVIPAYGFIIIWADEDGVNSGEIHANFKLSSVGEFVLLCDNSGAVLDSVAWGTMLADQSWGRCPNGYGPFITYTYPSFNGWNICPGSVQEESQLLMRAYPVPADNVLFVEVTSSDGMWELTAMNGSCTRVGTYNEDRFEINTTGLPSGFYVLNLRTAQGEIISTKRISVIHNE